MELLLFKPGFSSSAAIILSFSLSCPLSSTLSLLTPVKERAFQVSKSCLDLKGSSRPSSKYIIKFNPMTGM